MKEKIEEIGKKFVEWDNETHSNASQRQIIDWYEAEITALFDSELATYKELCEKQRELILKLDAFNQASNCSKIRIYRTAELRQKIISLETKIKRI